MHVFPTAQQPPPARRSFQSPPASRRASSLDDRPHAQSGDRGGAAVPCGLHGVDLLEAPLSPPGHERRVVTGSEAAAVHQPPAAPSPERGQQGASPRRVERNLNILTQDADRADEGDVSDGTRRPQREPRPPPTLPRDEGRSAPRISAAERVAIASTLAPSPTRERLPASSPGGGGGASDGAGVDRSAERADRVAAWKDIPVLLTP